MEKAKHFLKKETSSMLKMYSPLRDAFILYSFSLHLQNCIYKLGTKLKEGKKRGKKRKSDGELKDRETHVISPN